MSDNTRPRKVAYPKKCRMILVRDCTVTICNENNPGAVMLSALLYWYEHPWPGDSDLPNGDFVVRRTQEDIAAAACGQITTKTIHNVASPLLQLFGYLSVTEQMGGNLYTLHMERITAAYAASEQGKRALLSCLKSSLQLEKFLIDLPPKQLEKILIDRKFLQLQLEKILIHIRNNSNCKRGRKPRQGAVEDAQNEEEEILRDSSKDSPCPPTSEQGDDLCSPGGERGGIVEEQREETAGEDVPFPIAPIAIAAGLYEDDSRPAEPVLEGRSTQRPPSRLNLPTKPPGGGLLQGGRTGEPPTEPGGSSPPGNKTRQNGENKKNPFLRANWRAKYLREHGIVGDLAPRYARWEQFYFARCGGPPEDDPPYYAAVTDGVKLVTKLSDHQLEDIDWYLTTLDFKWKQAIWQAKLGAVEVWKEHQFALAYLAKHPRPAPGTDAPVAGRDGKPVVPLTSVDKGNGYVYYPGVGTFKQLSTIGGGKS